MDLRKKIIFQRAQRHLKQSLDSMDISELKPQRGRYNDRQIRDDADKQSRGRTFNGERRNRKSRYELYDDKDPVKPLRYAGKPAATKKKNEDNEAMIEYEKWRPISYTEWKNAELRKKEKEEKYKASTLAQRQNTSWKNVERKKRRQEKKVKSSTNTETPTRNAIKCGLKDRKKTTSRAPSVEIVGKSDNTNDRVSNRPKSPSVECIGVVPPRYNNRQSITTKTTMQLTVHKEYRYQN